MALTKLVDPVVPALVLDDGEQSKLSMHRAPFAVLSDAQTQGYTEIDISTGVTVADSQQVNQGWKVPAGAVITGNGHSPVNTTKFQTAFRLDGDNARFSNLVGRGAADGTNTATSEFISSRMAAAVDGKTLSGLIATGLDMQGYTTGIGLNQITHCILSDIRATRMRYSPTGLNSAGGYMLVCGMDTKHVNINNFQHILVPQMDRHTLYISAGSSDTNGWRYWNVNNIDSDYSANSVDNKGVSNVPFAMSPIHVRNGQNMNLNNHMVEGYSCSAMDYENQFGGIHNTNVNNIMSTDAQSFANGTLVDQGVLRLGYSQYGKVNKHHNFNNIVVKMVRGKDNSGNKMAAGTDNGVWGTHLQYVNFNNVVSTTESGYAMKLYNSMYVNIQNLVDELIDTSSGLNSVYLNNCSFITLGNIQSDRAATINFERTYTIEDNCSEITCTFPRRVVLYVQAGAVTVVEDRWKMLNGAPTLGSSFVNIPLKNHVSTNAKRLAALQNLTSNNVIATRVADAGANILRAGFWGITTGATVPVGDVNNVIALNFSS